jgi:hypothetical protein
MIEGDETAATAMKREFLEEAINMDDLKSEEKNTNKQLIDDLFANKGVEVKSLFC